MKINYCLPIQKTLQEEILETIEQNLEKYQYFEVWLDYIENLNNGFVEKLINQLSDKLIIVLRRNNLEEVKMKKTKMLEIVHLLNDSGCFLDLDIENNLEEIKYIKSNKLNIKTIISYHNYKETPDDKKLINIIEMIQDYIPNILKISTMCQSEKDAIRLLQLQSELKQRKQKHIVLGMGKFGTITRVFGTIWGNEMIFAPLTIEDQSAHGQLTKKQMELIFSVIHNS